MPITPSADPKSGPTTTAASASAPAASFDWPLAFEAETLLQAGLITREQCGKFVKEGALGSHLENLQRRGGFKGFNQKSVSVIITATDPRAAQFGA
jgi:hypothetical protein